MIWVILVGVVVLLVAILLRARQKRRLAKLGISGHIVFADTDQSAERLVSDRYGLVGKPDYIIQERVERIPVERKSRSVGHAGPYDGEVLQLAAYCLLVEERYGEPVHRGQLQYLNRSVTIAFDSSLRDRVLLTLRLMHERKTDTDVARSHNSPARCRRCGFRNHCDQSLA